MAIWDVHRATITQLYLTDDLPLADCISKMADDHGFRASRRQYLRKIEQWGIDKKIKTNEMKAVYSKIARRIENPEHLGKDLEVSIRGHRVEKQQLKRFMKRELEKAEARYQKDLAQVVATAVLQASDGEGTSITSQQAYMENLRPSARLRIKMSPCWGDWPGESPYPGIQISAKTPAAGREGLCTPFLFTTPFAPVINKVLRKKPLVTSLIKTESSWESESSTEEILPLVGLPLARERTPRLLAYNQQEPKFSGEAYDTYPDFKIESDSESDASVPQGLLGLDFPSGEDSGTGQMIRTNNIPQLESADPERIWEFIKSSYIPTIELDLYADFGQLGDAQGALVVAATTTQAQDFRLHDNGTSRPSAAAGVLLIAIGSPSSARVIPHPNYPMIKFSLQPFACTWYEILSKCGSSCMQLNTHSEDFSISRIYANDSITFWASVIGI